MANLVDSSQEHLEFIILATADMVSDKKGR